MHMDAPFCDVVLVVCTWMRFMMCDMFVLHVDASSLGCLGTWMPRGIQMCCYGLCTWMQMWMHYSLFWFFIYFDEVLCRMEVLHGVIDMPI